MLNRLPLFAAAVLALLPALALSKNEGCEKVLDSACPGWKTEGLVACEACAAKHASALVPACGSDSTDAQAKADKKCASFSTPTPAPGPPAPSPPTAPTPAPASPTPAPYPPLPDGPLPPFGPAPAPGTQPNFFLMLTDDQDLLLGSMDAMSFTRHRLGAGAGTNLTNFFAHTPGARYAGKCALPSGLLPSLPGRC